MMCVKCSDLQTALSKNWSAVEIQKAVAAYFSREQSLLFGFVEQCYPATITKD